MVWAFVAMMALWPYRASTKVITSVIDSTGDGVHPLDGIQGLGLDGSGNLFVAAAGSDNAFKVAPDGTVTQVIDATGDGGGNVLDGAGSVATDPDGNAYVTGFLSNNAFKITPGGVITEIIDATGDGGGNVLDGASYVATDADGNAFVSGVFSANVFKITPGGTVTQIIDATGDGVAPLNAPGQLAVDSDGNVYVVSYESHDVFKITPGGVVTNVAGMGFFTGRIAVDSLGNLYLGGVNQVARLTPGGVLTTVIDSNGDGTNGGAPIILNKLSGAVYVAVDSGDDVYVAGNDSNNAFRITPGGEITKIIDVSGDGTGNLNKHRGNFLNRPVGVVAGSGGAVFVAGASPGGGHDNVFRIETRCAPAPVSGCRVPVAPGKSKLVIVDKTPGSIGKGDVVIWKWTRGATTDLADWGDPLASDDFALCLYQQAPEALLLESAARGGSTCKGLARPCWKEIGTVGFKYSDSESTPDGVHKILVKAGADGQARAIVKAKGYRIAMPSLPLTVPVVAQLQVTNGECWEATFSAPGVILNEATQFKASSD